MKKILDRLKNNVLSNKKMLIFFITLLLVGIAAGSFFYIIINNDDKTLVNEFLDTFFNNIKNNNINYNNTLISSLINNLFFILVIWILGISVIGLPITLFMFFSKAFSLGFSIASIIMNYKFKGILYSLIYIFPSHIIYIVAYIIIMLYSVSLSLKLFNTIIKRKSIDFKYIISKYAFILLLVIILIIIAILFETYILPLLIKLALLI